jgi:hypothetical protein
MHTRFLLSLAAATALCVVSVAGASASHGRGGNQLFSFSGELLAAPGANASSVSVQIETGNKPGLKALIGASQDQVLSVGSGTQFRFWSNGQPHLGTSGDLKQGDYVTVSIRAPRGSSLQTIDGTQAATVADKAAPSARKPLWLFVGTVTGAQAGGKVALHVTGGNWKALTAMLGQSLDQSFSYDSGTIFLLWQGRVPTVIGPAELKAGDRITVRIRASRADSLGQVEATPAAHVGDHEPAPTPED